MPVSRLVTRRQRRRELEELRRLLLEEDWKRSSVVQEHQLGKIETQANDWRSIDELHDQLNNQHDNTTSARKQWSSQQIDQNAGEEAELENDAQRNAKKLGAQVKTADPATSLLTAMLTTEEKQQRDTRRIAGSTGSKGGGRKRNFPSSLLPHKVTPNSKKLGAQPVKLYRPSLHQGSVITS